MGVEGRGQKHAVDMKPCHLRITEPVRREHSFLGLSSHHPNKLDAITHAADLKLSPENKIGYIFQRNYFDMEKIYFEVQEAWM